METRNTSPSVWDGVPFKSYYVVWKLMHMTAIKNTTHGLNRTMQYGNIASVEQPYEKKNQFKSYYVVWKPDEWLRTQTFPWSLNRTMQYGNL